MAEFKRNDKVYVLESYTSRPKFSLTVRVPLAKELIIKSILDQDEFSDKPWARCEVRGNSKGYQLPIDLDKLFKYTKLGELLYG